MTIPPASLVQIHYHDRLGGVRQVMDAYSRAFGRIAGEDAPNYWICRQSGAWHYPHSRGVDLTDSDYRSFRSSKSYAATVKKITRQLHLHLEKLPLKYPVAIIGHNLNLGKNPALSAAFANCARLMGHNTNYRFFSVMHDFYEQGRIDLIRELRLLSEQGADVYKDLYADGTNVHFIVPSRYSADLTGLQRQFCSFLSHPINIRPKTGSVEEIRHALNELAERDGLRFTTDRPLYCYPTRIIRRKNIFEALLLATVAWEGALVIGAAGSKAADKSRVATVRSIARKYALPLCIDPARAFSRVQHSGSEEQFNPFTFVYQCTDFVLTTARAEGFGYALFEPWYFGKMVIGRRPLGLSGLRGLDRIPLYERLPVPASWIPVERCYGAFTAAYQYAYARQFSTLETFKKTVIKEDTIDFGLLDDELQLSVIRRLLSSDRNRENWLLLLGKSLPGWPGSRCFLTVDAPLVQRMKSTVQSWDDSSFLQRFIACLSINQTITPPSQWYRSIEKWYSRSTTFLPLVAPAALRK
jgi:hypothetical protein